MMFYLLAAIAASAPNPLMVNWANCMMAYSNPRLQAESVERLIDGSFAACPAEENAARRAYVQQFGEQAGNRAFEELKQRMRGLMTQRLTAAKQQSGN